MPAIPIKLFDARNGNNAIDSDATVYPNATIIVFRDAAAKTAAIDAVCDLGNYASLDPCHAANEASLLYPRNSILVT